jgi:hypothetical protein
MEEAVQRRVQALPGEVRRLLEVVCLSGQPLAWAIAQKAAQLGSQAVANAQLLTRLRADRLLRVEQPLLEENLVPYHDRIREAVIVALPDNIRKEHHQQLAAALQDRAALEPERLLYHYQGAGDQEQVARFALQAAEQAYKSMAFQRAARLFRAALDTSILAPQEALGARVGLADSLAAARRPLEAARAYLDAAATTAGEQALVFRRQALEQFLCGGHLDQGRSLLRKVVREVGLWSPPNTFAAVVALVLLQAFLALRGLGFRLKPDHELGNQERIRLDTCWSIAQGLGRVDLIHALYFQSRHLLMALRAGESYRLVRALVIESVIRCGTGSRGRTRTDAVLRTADELAAQLDNVHASALLLYAQGTASALRGEWPAALPLLHKADALFRHRCLAVSAEWNSNMQSITAVLEVMGRVNELAKLLPAVIADATERSDRTSAALQSLSGGVFLDLCADRPDDAKARVESAMALWSQASPDLAHICAIAARARIAMYRGSFREAYEHMSTRWGTIARYGFLRIQTFRVMGTYMRALAAVGADGAQDRDRRLRLADQSAQKLEQEGVGWALALAGLIRAGIAWQQSERTRAIEQLESAEQRAREVSLLLFATAARYRRGQWSGDAGRSLITEAEAWMAEQSIAAPISMLRTLVPGEP